MKIALVEPYVSVDSLKSYADKTEPSHLLGMYNQLCKAGCDVVLLDAYSRRLSAEELLEWVAAEGVTHFGATVYDYQPCLTYMQQVIQGLPDDIITIIGGPGPTYCQTRMIEMLSPDWLVVGAGEGVIAALIAADFRQERTACHTAQAGPSLVLRAGPAPLDTLDFERPYSLRQYDFQASPRMQSGCVGKCIFCCGAYQKSFDYLSKSKIPELFHHMIVEKNAKVVGPNGPDFTSIPQRANEILAAILEGNWQFDEFRPGVRLDTLARAVALDKGLWRQLAATYKISMESSIESFAVTRLERLGKNIAPAFLAEIINHLKEIFATCDCTIVLGRIALDPTITVDEFMTDCEGFRLLLSKFNRQVTVGGMLMNTFVPLPGTPSTSGNDHQNIWLKQRFADPAMRHLQANLLENEKFKLWCRLAEETGDFAERNLVFDEILRVAAEVAETAKSVCKI